MTEGFMGHLRIRNISFWSHLKLVSVFGLCFGFSAGITGFVVSFITPERVFINFFEEVTAVSGISAGLLGVFLWPLFCGIAGVIFGIITYFPFKLFLKIARGLRVNIRVS